MEQEIRKRFIDYGIPYDNIDKGMIPLIDILNFKFKIKTKYCCFGHGSNDEMYVMFDESVTDEQIMKLAKYLLINKWRCLNLISVLDQFYMNWLSTGLLEVLINIL